MKPSTFMNGVQEHMVKGKYTHRKFFICLLMLTGVLAAQEQCHTQEQQPTKKPIVWLTIFVHGIMSVKPHLNFNNFVRIKSDDVESTTYKRAVELMRLDPHFYQNQAMQGMGLKHIYPYTTRAGDSSSALAYLYEEMNKEWLPENEERQYYTYGWSGILSSKARYKDALAMYYALIDIVDKYQSQGKNVKLRLIGYSHGGNILLHLANVAHHEAVPKPPLVVDELIMVGMPVLRETDHLICDDMFKKIYHFFSESDHIVRLDFFSSHHFLSDRRFQPRHGFQLPNKLVQIEVKVTRPSRYALTKQSMFCKSQDYTNTAIVTGTSKLLRDVSPGHIELWFFGWTPHHYRDNFPLYPLPVVAYTPFVIHEITKNLSKLNIRKTVIADFRPEHEVMLLKQYDRHSRLKAIVPLLPDYELTAIKNSILSIAPDNYTNERYNKHLFHAVEQAQEEYKERVRTHMRSKRSCRHRKQKATA